MENKHIQYVDFSNPNADKITSGTTNKPLENKQTAVEWLVEEIHKNMDFIPIHIQEQAKEMERLQSVDDFTCGSFEGYKGANRFPSMLVNDYINKKYQK